MLLSITSPLVYLRTKSRIHFALICATLLSPLSIGSLRADPTDIALADGPKNDPFSKSLQELMDTPVYTTIERTYQRVDTTAAAVTVLTQNDIHRSGANSIPDALRLVPGLDVARVDAHTWAITSRGFNDVFANKLLVMIDGRTIYNPLFSGVFWDQQDTVIEDIERIEVVRGPGATLWGANAVNGVINVVTKSAKDTQGLLAVGGGGTEQRAFGSVRYGFKIDDGIYMRVYGKYFDNDSSVFSNGNDAFDSWSQGRGGFRIDIDKAKNNILTLEGEAYSGQQNEVYKIPTLTPPFAASQKSIDNVAGVYLLGRLTHDFKDSKLTVQAYYDRSVRNTGVYSETRDTGDIDVQHIITATDRHEITWGAGFRTTHRNGRNSLNVTLLPEDDTHNLYSTFVQDEIAIVPERFKTIIGTKFEHNDFTGFEVQPSIRALYTTAQSNQTVWASISRAVRTPSEAESDIRLNPAVPGVPPGAITSFGNPDMLSESLLAYEVGYRIQATHRLSIDLTAFYNDYSRLRSIDPLPPIAPIFPPPVHPSIAGNKLTGESYGGEAAITFQAITNLWRLKGGYSYLQVQAHRSDNTSQSAELMYEGSAPQNQLFILSSFDLPKHVQFDTTLRYVDRLHDPSVPSYVELDARLAWLPRPDLELAIVGQNLLHEHHPEFAPTFIGTQATDVERGVYGKLTFRY